MTRFILRINNEWWWDHKRSWSFCIVQLMGFPYPFCYHITILGFVLLPIPTWKWGREGEKSEKTFSPISLMICCQVRIDGW
jgi:hypothetical protein